MHKCSLIIIFSLIAFSPINCYPHNTNDFEDLYYSKPEGKISLDMMEIYFKCINCRNEISDIYNSINNNLSRDQEKTIIYAIMSLDNLIACTNNTISILYYMNMLKFGEIAYRIDMGLSTINSNKNRLEKSISILENAMPVIDVKPIHIQIKDILSDINKIPNMISSSTSLLEK